MLITKICKKSIQNAQTIGLLFSLACFCLLTNNLLAYGGENNLELFIDTPGNSNTELPEQALNNKGREVSINIQALRKNRLNIKLFGGRSIIAEQRRFSSANPNGSLSWIGEVAGNPGSLVVLTEQNGVVAGSITIGPELYQINPTSHGSHVFFQVDDESLPDSCHSPLIPEENNETSGNIHNEEFSITSTNVGNIIDLMVVYTPASSQRYGGQNGVEANIISAVEAANQAYLTSLIDMQLNIVHMEEVNYVETGNMSITLSDLKGTTDGIMDEVHDWRNTYGADQVAMISEDSNFCGIASVMINESTSFAPFAFSVTFSSCLSNKTLAHELGHNQGNMHDRENSGNEGAYPYSYGYRRCVNDGTGFRTIMSYSCSGGTRVNYFSNPNVTYNGFPTGIDHDIDPDNSADTARSMNNTADTVSAFRASVTSNPPAAPSNLSASATSYNQIDLSWTDNSNDETGFRVERTINQVDWTEIATLGSSITSYSDTGLDGSTAYYYKTRGYNGAGNSGYSNTASATTLNPPEPPSTPQNLTATAYSDSQIDLSWSDNSNETGYRIERSLDQSSWVEITILATNVTTYNDSGLNGNTIYYYKVRAYNEAGDSSYSNTASATTLNPPVPPSAPTNLTALTVSNSQIDLNWSDNFDETGYKVRRSVDQSNWTEIATLGEDTNSYSDSNNLQLSTTYYYQVMAFNNNGDSLPSNTANATTGMEIKYFATSDLPVFGHITGNYTNTFDDDNNALTISEIESGGKKTSRYSYLEHKWNFNIDSGFSVALHINAYKNSTNGDNFRFQYSTDNQSFVDIAEISSTDPNNSAIWQLPTNLNGEIIIGVIDSDRTEGNISLEDINIDQMFILVEADTNGTVPSAPADLTASSNQVSLTWIDNSSDEYGFKIERSANNSNSWSLITNINADTTTYDDLTTMGNTLYHYRVSAYNGSGSSGFATSNPITTQAGLTLSANGYKVKGIQQTDLSWNQDGTSSITVDIYRDGMFIDIVTNNGTYTDNIGQKGPGILSYQVCGDNGNNCSNIVNVEF